MRCPQCRVEFDIDRWRPGEDYRCPRCQVPVEKAGPDAGIANGETASPEPASAPPQETGRWTARWRAALGVLCLMVLVVLAAAMAIRASGVGSSPSPERSDGEGETDSTPANAASPAHHEFYRRLDAARALVPTTQEEFQNLMEELEELASMAPVEEDREEIVRLEQGLRERAQTENTRALELTIRRVEDALERREEDAAQAELGRFRPLLDAGGEWQRRADAEVAERVDRARRIRTEAEAAREKSRESRERAFREHLARGASLEAAGDDEGAAASYSMAINLDPESAEARLARARAFWRLGRLGEAVRDLDWVLAHDSAPADVWALRARCRQLAGEPRGAAGDWTRAIELEPGRAEYHAGRARARLDLDDPDRALEDSALALRIDPGCREARIVAARVWIARKEYQRAVEALDLIVRAGNPDAETHFWRAVARLETGDADGAMEDCVQAINLDANYRLTYKLLGDLRLAKGQMEGAISAYSRAIQIKPDWTDAYLGRALAYRLSGQLDSALRDYGAVLARDEKNVEAWLGQGKVRMEKKEFRLAAGDFDRALALDPGNAEAHFQGGRADQEMGLLEKAIEHFGRAIALDPDHAFAHLYRGLARRELGDLEGAIRDWEKAVEISGRLLDLQMVNLAKVWIRETREEIDRIEAWERLQEQQRSEEDLPAQDDWPSFTFEGGKKSIRVPPDRGWCLAADARSPFDAARGLFCLERHPNVTIHCVVFEFYKVYEARTSKGLQGVTGDNPTFLAEVAAQIYKDNGGSEITERSRSADSRLYQYVVRNPDGTHVLVATTLRNRTQETHMFIVEFASGAYDTERGAIDGILATFVANP
ncbi:MAG: tetratricopeptide repeat protein [Planctomycetes bacterium]|nr:tetratricopeptide repeat protein [Planctomycetota bacterium]